MGGAPGRNRTRDLRFTKPLLYQLSYKGLRPGFYLMRLSAGRGPPPLAGGSGGLSSSDSPAGAGAGARAAGSAWPSVVARRSPPPTGRSAGVASSDVPAVSA